MDKRINELCKLVLDGKMSPKPQSVTYDRTDIFLEEHEKNAKRIYHYVTNQKPILTKYNAMTGLLAFNGSCPGDAMTMSGMKNFGMMYSEFYAKPIDNLITQEWQHSTADFSKIIRKGVGGIIDDISVSLKNHTDKESKSFLNALKKCAEALIAWAHVCAFEAKKLATEVEEEEYKNNLYKLSDALLRVPEKPASNFYEAVLSIYVLFSYAPDSVGTLDRTLSDFYFNDINNGTLTKHEAKIYLQELFLMLQARTPKTWDRFTKGAESHFAIGGYLPNGEDGFNELSLLMLEALTELPTYIPQVSLRWTKKLPFETFLKVLDFERKDKHKRIAFVSDEAKIYSNMKILGFTFEQACSYTTLGCNEVAFPGGMVGGNSNSNGLHSIESTVHNRSEDIINAQTFDDFFKIFTEELNKDLNKIIDFDNNFNLIRSRDASYVTSLLFSDCVTEAKPFSQGPIKLASAGTSLIGIVNTIDSLAIIKQFVYDEKIVTMDKLVTALKADWVGYEDLRTLILNKGKFFGNDDETSNTVSNLLSDALYDFSKNRVNIWGYKLRFGNLQGYNPHHQWFGSNTKATPDGRNSGEKLKFGLGQNDGKDRNGLTALLNSVAKSDPNGIMTSSSSVTNIFLDEKSVKDDTFFLKTAKLLETYFLNGGAHFQLNYVSKEDLIKAKKLPDDYKTLRVRVSGFSDYFVNLPDTVQDDVIERTSHK